jgi:phi LC3 family holin
MNINWKVRFKSKAFWVALVPAVALLVQAVAAVFGLSIDLSGIGAKLLAVVEAIFVVLAILGIVVDPTTYGIGDSGQAMGYDEPRRG